MLNMETARGNVAANLSDDWRKRAEDAEAKAMFAELRIRVLEAQLDAYQGFSARHVRKKLWKRMLEWLRAIPSLLKAELKSVLRKVSQRSRREMRDKKR